MNSDLPPFTFYFLLFTSQFNMAKKEPKDKAAAITRYFLVCLAWAVWLFFTLSCVSFRASDPPSPQYYHTGAVAVQNWCGPVGALVAYHSIHRVGAGLFVGIVLLFIALV